MEKLVVDAGRPYPLGALVENGGTNFAVASDVADSIEVCLFDADGTETRIELPERTAGVFHGLLPDVGPGQKYGLRVRGPWDPANGIRCNPDKLLIDPHATAISGPVVWSEDVFAHHFDDANAYNDADSAAAMPKCVVSDRSFDWGDDRAPRIPLSDTVVYETHVKGISKRHPDVPEDIAGTYAGLAHPSIIEHLTGLGVTAVELLPVHQFVQDSHLLDNGLRNYWGYNSIGFLAPHGDYSSVGDDGGQVAEFKSMVKALHAAGLEVILDVVYNHTAEGNHEGPSLSMKGIDNPAYYRLVDDDRAHYFDTTGTGNSLNVGHPTALRLIMDSLRYWVSEMHVDGFRFDLATTLTRQTGELDIYSAFLDLIHQDPVLAPVKMIAEPWDTAGYQVGGFPARWSEWNGKYRDDVRDFWRGADGSLGDFALRLTGSGDIYSNDRRTPTASVNFITAHDGFTLADLTAYNDKHNEANGEDNNDGESNNSSWNCGVEGPTDDADVIALRERQRRNLLATLLLSAGVPMLLGGDEIGRTQDGNNNAYCQDDELSWYDWANADTDLLEFTKTVIRLRSENPSFRPLQYLVGADAARAQMILYRPDGRPMEEQDWEGPPVLAVGLDGRHIEDTEGETSDERFLVLVNAHFEATEFTLPGRNALWGEVLSTDPGTDPGDVKAGAVRTLEPRTLVVLQRR
jgi:isoamylase